MYLWYVSPMRGGGDAVGDMYLWYVSPMREATEAIPGYRHIGAVLSGPGLSGNSGRP